MDLRAAKALARDLMREHGLIDWTFKLNTSKRCLGITKYAEQRIELSAAYVFRNASEHVRDTILHEIAHALVGLQHGHDQVWKDKCLDLGCTPKACDDEAVLPSGDWQARCPGCLELYNRHRKPDSDANFFCKRCGPQHGRLQFRKVRKAKFKPVVPVRQGNVKEPRQLTLPFDVH